MGAMGAISAVKRVGRSAAFTLQSVKLPSGSKFVGRFRLCVRFRSVNAHKRCAPTDTLDRARAIQFQ